MELSTMLNSVTLQGVRFISHRLMSQLNQTVPLLVVGRISDILSTSGFEGLLAIKLTHVQLKLGQFA